jgi:hypothetical protein
MKTIALLAWALSPVPVQDDEELKPVEADLAHAIAERLATEAAGFEKPRLKIEPDCSKAVGLHVPEKTGLLLAPQKDLAEGESEGYDKETGKPLGYLFLYRILPLADGKKLDPAGLPTVTIKNDDGKEFVIPTLLLSVRRLADDDWRLYAFGKGEKPVLDLKFAAGAGPGEKPVGVQMKELDGKKDTLVVTVFDKYQARMPMGRVKE